jgi:hypothetical protein
VNQNAGSQSILSETGEAEAWFRKAIDAARRQNAKSYELRANQLGLAPRVARSAAEARETLANIYKGLLKDSILPI